MKQVKTYLCDNKVPSAEEISTAILLADKDNIVIELKWFYPYNGWHNVFVYPGSTYKDIAAKLPKVYGV
jgi:hypothetical protein